MDRHVEATLPPGSVSLSSIMSVGEPTGRPTHAPTWSPWLLFGGLAILALLLRLACFTGLIGSDDLTYSRFAQALSEGTYAESVNGAERRHHALRYAVIVPVAAVYKAFGVSEWTTTLVPLLASTLSVLLLAEIGRRMFGLRAGILAGLFYATFPIHLSLSTVLLPETILECYVLLGVLCYLQARDRGGAMWVLSGLLMGTAYLAKEPALFIAGAFLLHAIWERRWRGALLFAVGVAVVGAVELVYYLFVWGDLFFRQSSTRLHTLPPSETFFVWDGRDLAYRLFRKYPQVMLVPHLRFGLHSVVALALGALALRQKPRRGYMMLALWAGIPWLYLNFGSWSFQRYAPLPTDPRYLEVTYPPLILLSGLVLSRAFDARTAIARAAAAVLLLVLVVGVACGFALKGHIGFAREMTVLRELVHAAQANPGSRIYTDDDKWLRAMRVFDASVVSDSPESATHVLVADSFGMPSVQGSHEPQGGKVDDR